MQAQTPREETNANLHYLYNVELPHLPSRTIASRPTAAKSNATNWRRKIPAHIAAHSVQDDLLLEGNPGLNLAGFHTTYMEDEIEELMRKNLVIALYFE